MRGNIRHRIEKPIFSQKDGARVAAETCQKFIEQLAELLRRKVGRAGGQDVFKLVWYDILCDWISENVNKFQPEKEIGECYGMIETGADHNTAYINRTAFNRFCAENELPPKGLLSHLRSQNLIETGERGYTKTKRIRGVNTNCVWLRMENPDENLQNDDFDLPL